MKKIYFSILFITIALTVSAQKKFDSSAYTQFYENKWEKFQFQFDTTSREINLTQEERLAGLSKCWAEAKYNFANFDLIPNLNWDSLYQAFIPGVMAEQTTETYYKVLQNFYQYLRDGHSTVTLPPPYWKNFSGTIPLEIRWIENKVIVTKNSSADKELAAIKPGMELVAFNNEPVLQYIQSNISPYLNFSTSQDSIERIYRYNLLPGKAGSEVTMTFKDFSGKLFSKTIQRVAVEKFWEPYPAVLFKILPNSIGYLQINSFNDDKVVKIFDSLFSSIANTSALIIDIRNNGGGNGSNGFEILSRLTKQPFSTGKTALREYRPVGRQWGKIEKTETSAEDWKPNKKELYTKPVVVLTSPATYSAAEDFTATFKSMNRGKVIGEPTGGSTGQPILFSLPGGGFARVCAKRDFFSDGTEFVGRGIQPDIFISSSTKAIKENKDEQEEKAIEYLKSIESSAKFN